MVSMLCLCSCLHFSSSPSFPSLHSSSPLTFSSLSHYPSPLELDGPAFNTLMYSISTTHIKRHLTVSKIVHCLAPITATTQNHRCPRPWSWPPHASAFIPWLPFAPSIVLHSSSCRWHYCPPDMPPYGANRPHTDNYCSRLHRWDCHQHNRMYH